MSLLQYQCKAQDSQQQKASIGFCKDRVNTMSSQLSASIKINIENVVATGILDRKIDLKKVFKKFDKSKYNPDKFPGVIIHTTAPRSTILLFRTGSIVCTGTTSEKMAKNALDSFVTVLQKNSMNLNDVALSDTKIVNIVSYCNLGNPVHLEQAAKTLPRSIYEPEQFPGIIHRLYHPRTVILLFASGKLVCTGAKKTTDIHDSINQFCHILEEKNLFVKDDLP